MRRTLPFFLISALLLLLFLPLLQLGLSSVEQSGASLGAGEIFADTELFTALATSGVCALVATCLGVILCYPLAFALSRKKMPGERFVRALLSLPLVLPHPVAGIALLLLFSRGGLLGVFSEHGIVLADSAFAIVLAMLFVSAPYLVRTMEAKMSAIDPRLLLLAENLGATRARVFSQVLWPSTRSAVASAAVLGFARAVSEFGSVVVLAYFPKTAPVLIWDRFASGGLAPALPAAFTLTLLSFLLFLVWAHVEKRARD